MIVRKAEYRELLERAARAEAKAATLELLLGQQLRRIGLELQHSEDRNTKLLSVILEMKAGGYEAKPGYGDEPWGRSTLDEADARHLAATDTAMRTRARDMAPPSPDTMDIDKETDAGIRAELEAALSAPD